MQEIRTNNNTMIERLENRFKGYYEKYLNLNEFINWFNLDMILNNDIIRNENYLFEIYNYDELLKINCENLTDELKDIETELKEIQNETNNEKQEILINELLEDNYTINLLYHYHNYDFDLTISDNSESIEDYCSTYIHETNEVYQYFIISSFDVDKWKKYTDYPIFYNENLETYLIGITHFGMSWDYFFTKATERIYF